MHFTAFQLIFFIVYQNLKNYEAKLQFEQIQGPSEELLYTKHYTDHNYDDINDNDFNNYYQIIDKALSGKKTESEIKRNALSDLNETENESIENERKQLVVGANRKSSLEETSIEMKTANQSKNRYNTVNNETKTSLELSRTGSIELTAIRPKPKGNHATATAKSDSKYTAVTISKSAISKKSKTKRPTSWENVEKTNKRPSTSSAIVMPTFVEMSNAITSNVVGQQNALQKQNGISSSATDFSLPVPSSYYSLSPPDFFPMAIGVMPASTSTSTSQSQSKLYRPGLLNSFGQLGSFFGHKHFHYNFLFDAERHTVFHLHTSIKAMEQVKRSTVQSSEPHKSAGNTLPVENNAINTYNGRVLHQKVGNSLGSWFQPAATSSSSPSAGAVALDDESTVRTEEVQLYDALSLRQSRFNPFNPTRILIHGWFGGANAAVYQALLPEYLKLDNGSYNIFTVDWGRGAVADYITASYRVKPVGKVLAKFIDFLHQEAGVRFEDLHVVGFSMGAHVAGIAGKNLQTGRLPVIYGLDPALPLFRYENFDERLAITDADYVEVIHTSVGTYGYDQPIGHVDFYVNYGSNQPGCFFLECSHFRAYQIFAESLSNKRELRGEGCDVDLWPDLIRNRRCLMRTGRSLIMGGDPIDITAQRKRGGGVFYLTTNANPPYAQARRTNELIW